MNIGIDIDDTLTYSHELRLAYGQKFDYKNFGGSKLKNSNGRDTMDIFSWDEETDMKLWWEILSKAEKSNAPRPFAKEMIKKLREDGHKIFIISARDEKYFKKPYEESKQWLDDNAIEYDKIIIECKEKGKTCKELGINVFLDDKEENCIEVANEGIQAFIFDNVFNQNFNDARIKRVHSFVQFYYEINFMKK